MIMVIDTFLRPNPTFIFNCYAEEAGLTVRFQRLSGVNDGWEVNDLDCLSVIERPAS
jgi:hypothetical protein